MLAGEAGRERLYEVCVDRPAMRAGEDAAVVRVEVQSLMRVDQGFLAAVALESLAAAGHGSEDIVTVHGTEDQARTIPRLGAETTTYRLPAAALQTTHAHG